MHKTDLRALRLLLGLLVALAGVETAVGRLLRQQPPGRLIRSPPQITLSDVAIVIDGRRVGVTLPLPVASAPPGAPVLPSPPALSVQANIDNPSAPKVDVRISDLGLPSDGGADSDQGSGRRLRSFLLLAGEGGAGGTTGRGGARGAAPGDPPPQPAEQQAAVAALAAGLEPRAPPVNLSQVKGLAGDGGRGDGTPGPGGDSGGG